MNLSMEAVKMIYFIVVIFISSLVQGMAGFGFSLVAMPFLTLLLPFQLIVPILVICSLALNIIVFMKTKGCLYLKEIVIMFALGLLSTPIGVYLLSVVDEFFLKAMVGVLIIITSITLLKGFHLKFSNKYLSYGLAGFLSGILNGSVSLSGPPVVLMLVNEGHEKESFKKNISGYFLALNMVTIPSFVVGGFVVTEVVSYSIVGTITLIIGAFIGIQIGQKIDSGSFKKIVLFLIMTMGCMTLISLFSE